MKGFRFCFIFLLLVILVTLLIVALWCVLLPEDVKETLETFRWRRDMESETKKPPEWIGELIETNSNKTSIRKGENVLLNALGQLEISGPENIMSYITLESPCRRLKPYLNVYEKHRRDIPEKNLYVRLFKAIKKFHSMYCGREERYRKLFSQYQDELLSLHEQFVDCDAPPDWFENTNTSSVCKDAESVMKCYVETLRVEIGEVAAKAWKCIFTQVLQELMDQPCGFIIERRVLSSDADDVFGASSSLASLHSLLLSLPILVIFIFQ